MKKELLNNKNLIKIFQIIATIILLFILYSFVNLDKLKDVLLSINYYFIVIGMFLYILGLLTSSYKWKISILNITSYNIKIIYLMKVYWIGSFISNFLPSTIGGDSYRFYRINKKINNINKSFNSIFFERLSGVIALSLINIILFFVFYQVIIPEKNILYFIPLLFSISILSVFLLKKRILKFIKIKKIKSFLKKIEYNNNLLPLVIISFIFIFISTLILKTYLLAFGINYINFFYLMLLITSSNLIGMIPISLNSIGLSESIWVLYLTIVGVPIEISVSVALIGRVVLIIMTSFGGLFYLKEKLSKN